MFNKFYGAQIATKADFIKGSGPGNNTTRKRVKLTVAPDYIQRNDSRPILTIQNTATNLHNTGLNPYKTGFSVKTYTTLTQTQPQKITKNILVNQRGYYSQSNFSKNQDSNTV
jgi:hypothetical protein